MRGTPLFEPLISRPDEDGSYDVSSISGRGLYSWGGAAASHAAPKLAVQQAKAIAATKLPEAKRLEAGKQLAAAKNMIIDQAAGKTLINPLTTPVMKEGDSVVGAKRGRGRPRKTGLMETAHAVAHLKDVKRGHKALAEATEALKGSGLY